MSTPAGWYTDPNGAVRWWDGYRWTESVQPWAPAQPARVPEGTSSSTLWIWLIVALPVLSAAVSSGYFAASRAEIIRMFESSLHPSGALGGMMGPLAMYADPWYLASFAANTLVWGLIAWFAYLDQKELIRRGFAKTFPWGWGFLVLVYIIGRSVVVRRQTGRGLAPLWTAIVIEVLWIGLFTTWMLQLFSEIMRLAVLTYGVGM